MLYLQEHGIEVENYYGMLLVDNGREAFKVCCYSYIVAIWRLSNHVGRHMLPDNYRAGRLDIRDPEFFEKVLGMVR